MSTRKADKNIPLHPFVRAFVEIPEPVSRLCELVPCPGDPVVEAFRTLSAAYRRQYPDDEARRRGLLQALEHARGLPLKGVDPNLAILFMSIWSIVASGLMLNGEVASLLRLAKATLPPDAPPEIQTVIMSADKSLASEDGDYMLSLAITRRMLEILPPASPAWQRVLIDHGLNVAQCWQLGEVAGELESLAKKEPTRFAPIINVINFIDHLECGRAEDAAALLPRMEGYPSLLVRFGENISRSKELLGMMLSGAPAGTKLMLGNEVVSMLLARQPAAALAAVRGRAAAAEEIFLKSISFAGFNLVRAELAAGNAEAARRVMRLRRMRGNQHPIDEFFLARVELLAGRRAAAAALFASVMQKARASGAEGRIEFELRLACELSAGDAMWLLRGAGKPVTLTSGPDALTAARAPEPPAATGVRRLVGTSAAMESVRQAIARFAPLDVPVLITGETGTGKELVARALHEAAPRASEPFIAVNCAAIAETLLESELFGHERGAFTGADRARRGLFEEAGGGTILLDEIGDISPRLQTALLRVLEAGEIRPVGASRARRVRCRMVAATNVDLAQLAEQGRFRRDLLFRLERLVIHLPPLRERREDILPLADHFLCEGRADGRRPTMSDPLRQELLHRQWPGNARELRNEIDRMRLLNSEVAHYELAALGAGGPSVDGAKAAAPQTVTQAAAQPVRSRTVSTDEDAETLIAAGRSPLRRLDRLRALFRRFGKLTRAEAIKLLGVSAPTATEDLKALCREGLVERVTPSASTRSHYFVLRASADIVLPSVHDTNGS